MLVPQTNALCFLWDCFFFTSHINLSLAPSGNKDGIIKDGPMITVLCPTIADDWCDNMAFRFRELSRQRAWRPETQGCQVARQLPLLIAKEDSTHCQMTLRCMTSNFFQILYFFFFFSIPPPTNNSRVTAFV